MRNDTDSDDFPVENIFTGIATRPNEIVAEPSACAMDSKP
jgi:hypothetical protein